ncbi:MAG: glycosyltransferase [Bacteroidota bacterium]|nr:glycosyltransferase [Bacteroidota bacterium]MDP4233028.1 glycosyltransferase [Bacteroidota bacterium]MDP4241827.1 glycosyltransferase [Bacteroidota bacterium]MDP4288376.1 glycosyltransferase [Bacteroidota bacterium]
MDLSIIIVSYNVKEFLRGAIVSVQRALAAGEVSGEIIIVDNASTDRSVEMVRQDFPDVRLFALEENLGFGRANNLAMRNARGEQFLLLNPDTVVGEDTLRVMLEFMRAHPDAGLAGCKLLNSDGSFQISCRRGFPTPWASFAKLFGLSRLMPNSKLVARYNLTYLPIDQTYEVDALSGAFIVMTRAAFEATRGFDEDYFMYGEDLDLCYRAKQAGFNVYYVHNTATVHFQGESSRRSSMNEVAVFYEAMHIFVKKNYPKSILFQALLRMGIAVRTSLAFVQKFRGAVLFVALDFIAVALGVVIACQLLLGDWLALPARDYPYALLLPPLIAVILIAALRGYNHAERRSSRQVVLAMPAMLISFSSLTYFFKEYPASRAIVLAVTVTASLLLLTSRLAMRLIDRIRWGGAQSASPMMRRTIIIGTNEEARRIAGLLKRTEFLRRYDVIGFIDRSLESLGDELLPGIAIRGDVNMLPRLVRDERIQEVIFASDTLSHTAMLETMQRVASEAPATRVNFNLVPSATDVLIGRQKIELLSKDPNSGLALMPVELNLHRISHRLAKRLLDLTVSGLALPVAAIRLLIVPRHQSDLATWREIFAGRLTLVSFASGEARAAYYSKPGLTSLAAVAAPRDARAEDIHQFDQYYARNHTLGMDCEILLKALLLRRDRASHPQ